MRPVNNYRDMRHYLKCAFIFFLAIFSVFLAEAHATSLKLGWNPSSLSGQQGYKIYYENILEDLYKGTGLTEGDSPIISVSNNKTLSNLQDGRTYYFIVTSYSATTESDTSNKILVSVNDPATSSITGISSSNITSNNATITWATSVPTTSEIYYGKTTSYDLSTTLNPSKILSHNETISGLSPNTQYYYQVRSQDDQGNLSISGNMTFTTIIDSVVITTASLKNAVINKNYNMILSGTGGIGPYNWSVSSGILPAGISLNQNTGTISGTATSLGSSDITIQMQDSQTTPFSITKAFTITVAETSVRVEDGLVTLYLFDEQNGSIVYDQSGVGNGMDLTINDTNSVQWIAGSNGIDITSPSVVKASDSTKLYNMLTTTGKMTVEVWLTPADLTQTGPARIITYSQDSGQRNFTVGQDTGNINKRLRTQTTSINGSPDYTTASNPLSSTSVQHVVITYDGATKTVFVDGVQESTTQSLTGDFSTWDSTHTFALGNETTLDRPWVGKVYLLSIYNKALSQVEINQNYDAGKDGAGGVISGSPDTIAPDPPTGLYVSN